MPLPAYKAQILSPPSLTPSLLCTHTHSHELAYAHAHTPTHTVMQCHGFSKWRVDCSYVDLPEEIQRQNVFSPKNHFPLATPYTHLMAGSDLSKHASPQLTLKQLIISLTPQPSSQRKHLSDAQKSTSTFPSTPRLSTARLPARPLPVW